MKVKEKYVSWYIQPYAVTHRTIAIWKLSAFS